MKVVIDAVACLAQVDAAVVICTVIVGSSQLIMDEHISAGWPGHTHTCRNLGGGFGSCGKHGGRGHLLFFIPDRLSD